MYGFCVFTFSTLFLIKYFMHPVLFKVPVFGEITIYTYGFFVALGFLVSMLWISRESRLKEINPAKVMDLAFYVIVSAIIGARIMHVLVSERVRFLEDPLMIIKIWEGGLAFYGGLIASLLVAYWYIRRNHLPFWITSDVFAPAISLGHAVGRIGCFMAGCCYGREISHRTWYSLIFPENIGSFAPPNVPLYPTQLMEVFGELLIFSILLLIRYKKKFEGQLLASYLILYAILRAFNEYFRGDISRGFVIDPWLSTSQFISVILFMIGVIIYIVKLREKKEISI